MVKPEDTLRHPLYKELSKLVLDTPAARRDWRDDQEVSQGALEAVVSGGSFRRYKNALNLLFNQINDARMFYDRNSPRWDHNPKTFSDGTTATFPHSCKEFRGLIISLTPQYRQVEAEVLRMEQEAEDARTPKPKPKKSKSGWWKALLLVGLGVVAAHLPSWWGNFRNREKEKDNKPRVENRQNVVTNQTAEANGAVKQGNVYAAPATASPAPVKVVTPPTPTRVVVKRAAPPTVVVTQPNVVVTTPVIPTASSFNDFVINNTDVGLTMLLGDNSYSPPPLPPPLPVIGFPPPRPHHHPHVPHHHQHPPHHRGPRR